MENVKRLKHTNLMNWLRLSKASLLLVLCFFLGHTVQGQDDFQELKKKYAGQSEVTIEEVVKLRIDVKKGKLRIREENYFESLILSENGIGNASERFYESELVHVPKFEAYTLSASSKKIKPDLVKQSKNDDASIFYDGIRENEVIYKSLEPGARKVLRYTSEFTDPHLLHRFLFHRGTAACKVKYIVDVSDKVEMKFFTFHMDESIKYDYVEKKGRKIYTWQADNLERLDYEENMASVLYSAPHVVPAVAYYMDKKSKVEVLGSLDNLYAYYYDFVKHLDDNNEDLKELALSITEGADSEEEKVKKIFYWVKDNVKYVAYENGYEGFRPRDAILIEERRFGDCKDMANIITVLSKQIGIESVYRTWIGSRKLPYTYASLPTPATDNHMIATYVHNGEYIYLDATDGASRYGLPTGFIQGKEALIGLSKDEYIVKKVPVIAPENNSISVSAVIEIEGKKTIGKGTYTYDGIPRAHVINSASSINADRRFEKIKNRVSLGNNSFVLDDYTEKGLKDRDSLYQIDFDFQLKNYALDAGDTYINLHLKKQDWLTTKLEDRKFPRTFSYLAKRQNKFTLQLKEGQNIKDLPESFVLDNDLIYYKSEYEVKDREVILTYTYYGKKILLESEDFESWNESVKALKSEFKKSIVISKD